VTKPHLTLQELAPFADVGSAERARGLWNTGLRTLWEASPPELQQQYPLDILRRHRSTGVPISAERKARIGEAHKGKQYSTETRAKIGAGKKGKKHSPKTREQMSAARRKYWERRRQQEAGLTQSEEKQHEAIQIFLYYKKF
jgi:NUMOD3 motif